MTPPAKGKQKTQPARTGTPERPEPRQVIGRFLEESNGAGQPPIALFCHEPPDSFIGDHVANVAAALVKRDRKVHLFSRHPFTSTDPRWLVHVVGTSKAEDYLEEVSEFNRRASNAFMKELPGSGPVGIIAYEWTSSTALTLLKGLRNLSGVLSLHSLERQRSDLGSEISRKILAIEHDGIQAAGKLLIHDPATADAIRQWIPPCAERITQARTPFPVKEFESNLDAGAIKTRHQIGPVDPTILFVGDLDERYGPDLVLKAMPAILRHHPQARLAIVGDGQLFWPLRVFSRYLLLEHAVRLLGDIQATPLSNWCRQRI